VGEGKIKIYGFKMTKTIYCNSINIRAVAIPTQPRGGEKNSGGAKYISFHSLNFEVKNRRKSAEEAKT